MNPSSKLQQALRSLAAIALASGLACGCEDREAAVERAEQFFKERSSPRGKAGMLRALEVVHSAHAVVDDVRRATEPDCRLRPPDGAFVYEFTLALERGGPDERTLRWRETRTTTRDESGNLGVELAADATTELGLDTSHEMSWRLIGPTSYVSADAQSYYARQASHEERERLEAVGLGSLQALLDAAPVGWQRQDGSQPRWTLGGDRLVCGPSDPRALGWLRRLAAHATPAVGRLEASAERVEQAASPTTRTLDLQWALDDGTTLRARFEDRLTAGAEPVDVPAPEDVVDVERDRSLEAIDRLLEELDRKETINRLTESPGQMMKQGSDDETK